jgi:N-acylglucosamine 2-epimerase
MKKSSAELAAIGESYRTELLDDTVPFWLEHSIDSDHGGYLFCLGREGEVIDTDKPIWIHGRFVWLLSTLYRTVDSRREWLDVAAHGVEFLRRHGFDTDGRMYFLVDREGRPLRKRRYLFSECFAVLGLAAYGRAANDQSALDDALRIFELIIQYYTTPGLLPAKTDPSTRASRGIAMPMMLMTIARELYDATGSEIALAWIDRAIDEVLTLHVKRSPYRVLETVTPEGDFIDHFEGRCITPGHVIEAGWFILDESRRRGGDSTLTAEGTAMIDWAFDLGWDEEFGGIIYYRDIDRKPPTEYWHDMKFWWQHNEAIIAALLAHHLTGEDRYLDMHRKVHEWSYRYFPDPQFGEWYGYLRRDGAVSTPLKGNWWKGPFHLPRMLWYCSELLAGHR